MQQFKLILRPIAVTLMIQAAFMAVCSAVAAYYGESAAFGAFLKTVILMIATAVLFLLISVTGKRGNLSLRAGFLLVASIWLSVGFFGALPYFLSGYFPNFADAFFESMSGFTTTGSSVLSDIEILPQSILLWRGLTHWLGGGGIIVLSVAILPLLGVGGIHMMKAETTGGKLDKLSPRIAETAKMLWLLYLGMTAVATVLLLFGGMGVIDALCHAFSAISTGGLSSKNSSVAFFNSAYIDWVLIVFMMLGAMNFVLLIRVLRGDVHYLKVDSEFKAYIAIFIVATAIVTLVTYGSQYPTWEKAFRFSAFQVASIYTTTGFATADYELWPAAAQAVIFILFFIGGCSGSTSGGIKVVRYVVMIKQALTEMKYLLHPRGVFTFRLNGSPVTNTIVHSVLGYFIIYILTVLAVTLIVTTAGIDVFSAFTASLGSIGTIGPGFGMMGPTKNYSFLPDYVKYVLAFAMLIGRLEFYTLLVIITPWFWKR